MRQFARFRLRELLLLITVIALAAGLLIVSRRAFRAELELSVIRDEAGHTLGKLHIEDQTQVHIRAIQEEEPNTWRWRVFIPKGHKYDFNAAHSNIPGDGLPVSGMSGYSNEPYWEKSNEVLISAYLRPVGNGDWRLSVDSFIANSRNQMSGVTLTIPGDAMKWMSEIPSKNVRHLGSKGQESVDPKGPIVLLQQRANKKSPNGTYESTPEPSPGFMIWLKKI